MELAINEIPLVVAAFKLESTIARLCAVHELACVLDLIIVPRFRAIAVLLVIEPLTLVHGAVGVNKSSIAIGFSVEPLSLIDVIVGMSHSALAIEERILGHALVTRTIGEDDNAETFPGGPVFFPLALVFSLFSSGPMTFLRYGLEVVAPVKILPTLFIINKSVQVLGRNHWLIQEDELLLSSVRVARLFEF